MPRGVPNQGHQDDQAKEQSGKTDQRQHNDQGSPPHHGSEIKQDGAYAGHHGGDEVGIAIKQHGNRHGANCKHEAG